MNTVILIIAGSFVAYLAYRFGYKKGCASPRSNSSSLTSTTMEIWKIPIEVQKLKSIPEAKRVLFVQLGHVANEVNMLQKLVLFSIPSEDDELHEIERRVLLAQVVFLIRLLAGKLRESWGLLQKDFFSTGISKEYEPILEENAKDALQNLKRYFGKPNLIHEVRNYDAFHFSSEGIADKISQMENEETFFMYLPGTVGNSFYQVSDLLKNLIMLERISAGSDLKSLDRLQSEVLEVSVWFSEFIGGIMILICKNYLGSSLSELGGEKLEISGVPVVDQVKLPFFVERD